MKIIPPKSPQKLFEREKMVKIIYMYYHLLSQEEIQKEQLPKLPNFQQWARSFSTGEIVILHFIPDEKDYPVGLTIRTVKTIES